jgi:predicted glycoside hydrolase/deacetylase ChbG (UPF0249 family)
MTQKAVVVVIDAFSDAVCQIAGVSDPAVRAELNRATGDLIEAFGTQATNLAAHEVVRMIHQMIAIQAGMTNDEARIELLEKRTERRQRPREEP